MSINDIQLYFTVTTDGVLHTSIGLYENFPTTFLSMFNAPFMSAFINVPPSVLNSPLLIRLPLYKVCFLISSSSKKLHLEV